MDIQISLLSLLMQNRVKKFFFLNKSYLSLVVFFGKEIFDAMASIFGV